MLWRELLRFHEDPLDSGMSFLEILVIRICYLPAFYFTGCDQSLINGLSGDLGFISFLVISGKLQNYFQNTIILEFGTFGHILVTESLLSANKMSYLYPMVIHYLLYLTFHLLMLLLIGGLNIQSYFLNFYYQRFLIFSSNSFLSLSTYPSNGMYILQELCFPQLILQSCAKRII